MRREGAWWITGWPEGPAADNGPYDSKAEAQEDRRALQRHIDTCRLCYPRKK